MFRKIMIGGTALALAVGVMTMPKPASAEPWWVWPAVAGGTAAGFAIGTAAATGPYYDAGYYDPDGYGPSYYHAGYYDPYPAYYGAPYGYRCHYVITEQAPDGTGFRERVCR